VLPYEFLEIADVHVDPPPHLYAGELSVPDELPDAPDRTPQVLCPLGERVEPLFHRSYVEKGFSLHATPTRIFVFGLEIKKAVRVLNPHGHCQALAPFKQNIFSFPLFQKESDVKQKNGFTEIFRSKILGTP